MTCPGSLPPDYRSHGVSSAAVASRVTSFPPNQQLTKLCEAAGCSCLRSGLVTCWPTGPPFFIFYAFYHQECSAAWCYCFDNKENTAPSPPEPLHPNVDANNRAPTNLGNAPPIAHHRKHEPPGAACASWNDCAGEDYVCKVPNSGSGQGQPQPGTCTWFANAVAGIEAQCQRGRCLSAANSSNTNPLIPRPIVDSIDTIACACNCTYVSQACCSTADGYVYEDARQKVSTISASPGSFCNPTTGDIQDVVSWVSPTNNTVFSNG